MIQSCIGGPRCLTQDRATFWMQWATAVESLPSNYLSKLSYLGVGRPTAPAHKRQVSSSVSRGYKDPKTRNRWPPFVVKRSKQMQCSKRQQCILLTQSLQKCRCISREKDRQTEKPTSSPDSPANFPSFHRLLPWGHTPYFMISLC